MELLPLSDTMYFAGGNLQFTFPRAPVGSAFQARTWALLSTIPLGETRSYCRVADRLGVPARVALSGARTART